MPPQLRSQTAIIKENMSEILKWVNQGYTLGSIHRSLKDDGVIKCGLSNFKRSYYIFRNSGEVFSTTDNSNTQLHASEQPSATDKLSEEQVIPVEEEPPMTDKNKALIPDFDYEENQRLARMIFDRRKSQ